MISPILGISLVVTSPRAGIDIRPMMGPRTRPRNRSMIVQAAPPATWKNSSGHRLLTAMARRTPGITIATRIRPFLGTISKSGLGTAGGAAAAGAASVGTAISVTLECYDRPEQEARRDSN